jgi:signal transduction histidine kinase
VRLQLQFENALALAATDAAVFIEAIEVASMIDYLRDDFPELRISVNGEARVRADRRALESVLRNLLQNAVVHGRATNVSLDIRRGASGAVEMTVTDDGGGASVDVSTVLDRPFVRPATTSGSGIGLYVCGRLLNQMQGEIRLAAPSGRGFAVHIVLPGAA